MNQGQENTMQNVEIEVRNVYGKQLCYPTEENGRIFSRLTRSKTLSPGDLNLIKQLGYTVTFKTTTI